MVKPLLLSMLAVVGVVGCQKKAPEPASAPDVNPVEVSLQVAAVTPATVRAGKIMSGTVMGSGFAPQSKVMLGPSEATVTYRSENELLISAPGLPVGVHDVVVTNPDGAEAKLRAGLTVEQAVDLSKCGYVVIYFDTDQSSLTAEARRLLSSLTGCFSSTTSPIDISGHADARGTTDYNLALGQRRARAVEQQLGQLGVPMSRVSTTSWGEERPAKRGWGETIWAQNRRVELTIAQ
ncbi:MAG: OmpA family protein [Myxococcota bacterium]